MQPPLVVSLSEDNCVKAWDLIEVRMSQDIIVSKKCETCYVSGYYSVQDVCMSQDIIVSKNVHLRILNGIVIQ